MFYQCKTDEVRAKYACHKEGGWRMSKGPLGLARRAGRSNCQNIRYCISSFRTTVTIHSRYRQTANEIELVLPSSLTEKDYTSLVATVTSSEGFAADIATRSAATSGWSVKIIQPTFTEGVLSGNAKVKLSLPENKTDYKALLKVTVIDTKGQEHSASRIVWYQGTVIIDNPNGSLSGLVTDPATVEQLSVIGTLTDSDFQFIREKMNSLEVLDLSRATITKLPQRALAFYQSMNLTSNSTLHTVILPEGLTTIAFSVFAECTVSRRTSISRPLSLRSGVGCSRTAQKRPP